MTNVENINVINDKKIVFLINCSLKINMQKDIVNMKNYKILNMTIYFNIKKG